MKIAFLSNYFNHHQKPLSDAFYSLLGDGNYYFIETMNMSESRKEMGWREITAPYVIKYSKENSTKVEDIIKTFDVIIHGSAPLSLVKQRYYHKEKLTFQYSERRYKTISRYLCYPIYTIRSHYINKGYLLSASAYAPIDYLLSGMKLERCFRWGYFPEVKTYDSPEMLIEKKGLKHSQGVSILWAGRLIGLKHPESTIFVARRLKADGVNFELNIIGTGKLENKIMSLIQQYNLVDCVHMLGPMTQEEVRRHMEEADIFLFTSDRHEGWGAVLNESMNSGCAVVADENIGSVPYLIKDKENGLIYKSTNWQDLYNKVIYLVTHPKERKTMGKNAYNTMHNIWNSKTAAENFIKICESIIYNTDNPIKVGPCSAAPLVMTKWKYFQTIRRVISQKFLTNYL